MKVAPFSKKTVRLLWDDEYISKNMLSHHLSFDDDIASRNYETISNTVEFITSRLNLNEQSSVMDFGCGPGLYTNLFEQKGIKTFGIDFSRNSIDFAKSQNKNVTYINHNYLNVEVNHKFDLVIQIYCDFCVLSKSESDQLLQNVKRHLKPNGYFFFDVHNEIFFKNQIEQQNQFSETDGFFIEGDAVIDHEVWKYENELVVLNHYQVSGNRKFELYNWLQCYTKKSIEDKLIQNGFEIVEIYGNTIGQKKDTDIYTILAKIKDE